MKTSAPRPDPRLWLGLLLFITGMVGVVALVVTVLPQLVDGSAGVPALWVVSLASLVQGALVVALAVWCGVLLGPKVGLRAPGFEAVAFSRPVLAALGPQILPGLLAGGVAGIGLFAIGGYASPAAVAGVEPQFTVPLFARVLYGGITEELLLRWGVMTLLVWLAWRLLQRRQGVPRAGYVWLAIVASAVLFGAGHLPAVAVHLETWTPEVVLFVIGANGVFGVLFGYLFWRYGLEAAMMAHALAHVVAWFADRIVTSLQ
ncbi:type II CAAX prenyl endopeptidase Rce1 family protein [Thioalkalivibrio sp. HL-Eb18]|uniref:CPBP family glutamic-type intramembrane protease n=1 Tax=Thioalkalivibrio sp. HL-Eb18 TaxID=1266913 RepID=UPI0003816E2A|nr:CPBP family glutamic-type intramembrane protease [Thioalkalivibrio sp. HL-Eb18]